MNNSGFKRFSLSFLAIVMLIGLSVTAGASGSIFVNNGNDTLGQSLSESVAVGSAGNASLTGNEFFAITSDGVEAITEQAAVPGDIPVGEIGVTTVDIPTDTVKVGLYYYYSRARDSSLDKCNLNNYVGSGFEFGYYDGDRNFHSLGTTSATGLTVMKDMSVTVGGSVVGAYHIKLSGSYNSYVDAKAVADTYGDAFPAYYNGIFYVMKGSYKSMDDANTALASQGLSGEAFTGSNKCITVTKESSADILFEFDAGDSLIFAVRPVSNNGKGITTVAGNNRYYGDIAFLRHSGGNMTVVSYVNMEDYVKGVIPYEMSSSWPKEALKAQALCARTYIASNINQYWEYGFDITNDTYSQVYHGTASANSVTDAAVEETKNLYVTYDGRLASTLYFSSDGGATENSENVFVTALPYLRGKLDPYEEAIDFTYKTWQYEFTPAQITSKLNARGYGLGTVTSFDAQYTEVGNMGTLTFYDANGNSASLTKTNNYSVLGLPGINFTIEFDEAAGLYKIDGGGWGHNVGMSQWGAYSMAQVYGLNYAQILSFYYTGVDISRGV